MNIKVLKTIAAICLTTGFALGACAAPSNTPAASPSASAQPTQTVAPAQSPDSTQSAVVPPEPIDESQVNGGPGPAEIPENKIMVTTFIGTYDGVTDETGEDQVYIKSLNESDSPTGDLLATLTDGAVIVDAKTGKPQSLDSIKSGSLVVAYTGPQMTRSIPPQADLFALITNVSEDLMGVPSYMEVSNVTDNNGALEILNENQDLVLTVPKEVLSNMTNFATGDKASAKTIKQGTKLLAWFDIATLSMPAQATADKIIVINA